MTLVMSLSTFSILIVRIRAITCVKPLIKWVKRSIHAQLIFLVRFSHKESLNASFLILFFTSARRNIYMDTVHPVGWEQIQNLENRTRYERLEVSDLPNMPPRFTSELRVSIQDLK